MYIYLCWLGMGDGGWGGGDGGWGGVGNHMYTPTNTPTKYCVVRFNVLIHEMLLLFVFFLGGGGEHSLDFLPLIKSDCCILMHTLIKKCDAKQSESWLDYGKAAKAYPGGTQ